MELGLHRRVGAGDGLYRGDVSDPHSRRRQRLFLGRSIFDRRGAVAVRLGLFARDDRVVRRGISADPGDPAGDDRDHLVLQPGARAQGTRRNQRLTYQAFGSSLTRTGPTVSLRAGIIAFVAENEP